ncbi:MAG: IclR family transcriptional regulator C-terminal domain-containing protein [Mesorhizobium sp.]|nr:IclR family transcriptional regulator C-terminal domain-containing protein [Mesorhizobium sp.]
MKRQTESTAPEASPHDRDRVGALEKGLAVMEILAARPDGMTLTEMAEAAGLTRAGARRFLLTLVASGYALQDGRRFRLSPRLLTVARTWVGGASLWSFAEPFMREVSESLNESCSAAVLSDLDVVYVARVGSTRILSVALHVGTRLPAWCTSMGRVLVAGLPDTEVDAFARRADPRALTPKSLTDPAALAAAIRQARADGFALVDEELELGLRSIAVPIRDRAGKTVAAINVSTQAARFTAAEMRREILPLLRKAAAGIEDYFVVQ